MKGLAYKVQDGSAFFIVPLDSKTNKQIGQAHSFTMKIKGNEHQFYTLLSMHADNMHNTYLPAFKTEVISKIMLYADTDRALEDFILLSDYQLTID